MENQNKQPKPTNNISFQFHNYSFAAIRAFILEVKKYPILYTNGNPIDDDGTNSLWPVIVSTLLENGADYNLTASQRIYWERIYRGMWMWMRHILTRDMVGRYLGYFELSRNPKYIWVEDLKFVEPFIQLTENLSNYDSDLDPCIQLQVLSSEEISKSVYCNYMVFWKQFQEELIAETYYVSICVHTEANVPNERCKLGLVEFFDDLTALIAVPPEEKSMECNAAVSSNLISQSTRNDSCQNQEDVPNLIEEQLMAYLTEGSDCDDFLTGYADKAIA